MEIDGIGTVYNQQATAVNQQNIEQEDFIRLFLAQLSFQDPLEPLDNREFLAQLAQFSSLAVQNDSNAQLTNLLQSASSSQSLNLLGKTVDFFDDVGSSHTGNIISVRYTQSGPRFTVSVDNNPQFEIGLSQVYQVTQLSGTDAADTE